jgi:hypothetical protein
MTPQAKTCGECWETDTVPPVVRLCPRHASADDLYEAAFFARNRLLQDSGDQESIDKLNRALKAYESKPAAG